ncbi:hypothetical protein ACHQM5_015607 [Ranunculus cassubicifolius]
MTPETKATTPDVKTPPVDDSSVVTTNKVKPVRKVTRVIKTIVKKKVLKPKSAAAKKKAAAAAAAVDASVEESVASVEGITKQEESDVGNVNEEQVLKKEHLVAVNADESLSGKEEVVDDNVRKTEEGSNQTIVECPKEVESESVIAMDEEKEGKGDVEEDDVRMDEEQEEKGDAVEEAADTTKYPENKANNIREDVGEEKEETNIKLQEGKQNIDDTMETIGNASGQEGFEEPADEDCEEEDSEEEDYAPEKEEEDNAPEPKEEDNAPEPKEEDNSSDPEEHNASGPEEDAKGLEEENREISAHANERRSKKAREIFVGGLDRDTVEDDILKVFQKIGEVTEVRLHKNQSTYKNKGYAFVKFANKELARKALTELKHPMIRGKRCGVAPSEDNDTLFVGNICNTWTKEAIKTRLKEFGLEGVEYVNLVTDPQHQGLSRGFAFVEFSSHAEAMLAYKRLQKRDVIFGHAERTVKVGFAEPLREPDPEIMAQVKSVYVDGLPPHWDEERVREIFKPYGEVERIMLARNMPSAKRKDFGFVDFDTHEAATACINGLNNMELGNEKSKSRVKVRLCNPLPKTQAVKGGLCGGFRIGQADSGFSRFGKRYGQEGRPSNSVNSQRHKDSQAGGRSRTDKYYRAGPDRSEDRYSRLRERRPSSSYAHGEQRGYKEEYSSRVATSSRPDHGTSRYFERGHERSDLPRRRPYSRERHYDRHMDSRQYVDDPYIYEDGGYALKRSYSMLDHEPGYLEPNRPRPRFDHPDPMVSSRETRYQDPMGAERGLYPDDYYSSGYGGGANPSMYRGERPYESHYYY